MFKKILYFVLSNSVCYILGNSLCKPVQAIENEGLPLRVSLKST